MRTLILLTAVVAAAAVNHAAMADDWKQPKGRYFGFADYLAESVSNGLKKGGVTMPADVEKSFARCATQATLDGVPASDMESLDAAARGEAPVTDDRVKAQTDKLLQIVTAAGENSYDQMVMFCLEDVPDYQKYLKPQ